ncbi:hypothetical protein Abol_030_069 [Acetobacter orleanensis JCM 7639]|nr:hypothetical protein Abol_030_069 [Acetobacter orleanensis JCM 7639]
MVYSMAGPAVGPKLSVMLRIIPTTALQSKTARRPVSVALCLGIMDLQSQNFPF